MSIWNNLAGVIGDLLDPEFEERKRKAEFDPTKPMAWDVPQSGADSLPDSPSVNPSLRRMFSKGGFSSDEPVDPIFARAGRVSDTPLTTPEPTASPYEGDPTHSLGGRPMASPDELKPPSMSPLPRRASDITAEAPVFNNPWAGDPTRTPSGRMIEPDAAPEGLSRSVPSTREPTRIQQLTDEFEEEKALPADINRSRKKKTFWNRLGGGALGGLKNYLSGEGGQAGILGDVLMGGLERAFDPKADAEASKDRKLKKIWNDLNQEGQVQGVQQAAALKNAQIQNIYDDNERERTRIQLADMQKTADLNQRRVNDWYKRNKSFDPAKATAAQRAELTAMGRTPEEMGKYDLSNPKFKQIGDSTFEWDAAENAWVETNLPKDRSKKFTEITVKDPDTKQEYKFVTTEEKAAGLINSRQVAGLQIEAAKDRQLSQQTFQAGQNELTRKESLRRWVVANKVSKAKFKADLDEKVAIGMMTQEQANAALADFPE